MNKQTLWRTKNLVGQSLAGIVAITLAGGVSAYAQTAPANLDGRWSATMTQHGGTAIPFRLDITGSGDHLVGTLHNGGTDIETTTSASLENGVLKLSFEHYLTNIEATVKDGELDGKIIVTRRSAINITPGKLSEAPGDSWLPPPKRWRRFRISMAYGRCRTILLRVKSRGA
jgi:hypothetical protein